MKKILALLLSVLMILSCTAGMFTFTAVAQEGDTRIIIDENDPSICYDDFGRAYYPYEGKNYYLHELETYEVNWATDVGDYRYSGLDGVVPTIMSGFGYGPNILIIFQTAAVNLPAVDLAEWDYATLYVTTTDTGAPDPGINPIFGFTSIDEMNLLNGWHAYGWDIYGPEYGPGDYVHASLPDMSTARPNRSGISDGTSWSAWERELTLDLTGITESTLGKVVLTEYISVTAIISRLVFGKNGLWFDPADPAAELYIPGSIVRVAENDPAIQTDGTGRPYYTHTDGRSYYLNKFETHDVNFDTERGDICYADPGYTPPTFVSGFGYSRNIGIIGITCAFDLPELDLNRYEWAKIYITTTNEGAPDPNNIPPVFGFTDVGQRNLMGNWWAYGFNEFGPEYGPGDFAHGTAPAMSEAAPNLSDVSNGTDWSAYEREIDVDLTHITTSTKGKVVFTEYLAGGIAIVSRILLGTDGYWFAPTDPDAEVYDPMARQYVKTDDSRIQIDDEGIRHLVYVDGKDYVLRQAEPYDVDFTKDMGSLCYADPGYTPPTPASGFGYNRTILIVGITCAFDLPQIDLKDYDYAEFYISTNNTGDDDNPQYSTPIFGFTDINGRNLLGGWYAYGFNAYGPEYGAGDYAHVEFGPMSEAQPNLSGISDGTDWSGYERMGVVDLSGITTSTLGHTVVTEYIGEGVAILSRLLLYKNLYTFDPSDENAELYAPTSERYKDAALTVPAAIGAAEELPVTSNMPGYVRLFAKDAEQTAGNCLFGAPISVGETVKIPFNDSMSGDFVVVLNCKEDSFTAYAAAGVSVIARTMTVSGTEMIGVPLTVTSNMAGCIRILEQGAAVSKGNVKYTLTLEPDTPVSLPDDIPTGAYTIYLFATDSTIVMEKNVLAKADFAVASASTEPEETEPAGPEETVTEPTATEPAEATVAEATEADATEPVTEADAAAADTAAESETTVSEGGCASVLSGIAVMAALAGMAVVIGKKKKD